MPTGAHWTLLYEPTVDGRIQARVHAQRLKLDEFVSNFDLTISRDETVLEVQFSDDRDRPYDEGLAKELDAHRALAPSPSTERSTRSIQQVIEDVVMRQTPRRMSIQSIINPIRTNLDYVSTSRRPFLVPDLQGFIIADQPYAEGARTESLESGIASIVRLASDLGIQSLGSEMKPTETPEWLVPGVWVRNDDTYAEVVEISHQASIVDPTVHFKVWRCSAPIQTLSMRKFQTYWTQCVRPSEPPTRYDRIKNRI